MNTATHPPGTLPPAAVLRSLPSRSLARSIVKVCDEQGIAVSRFGRDAANDPGLLMQLRAGRELREGTRTRVLAHLETLRAGKAVMA